MISAARISVAFQLLAHGGAVLNWQAVRGGQEEEAETAEAYVDRVSSSRISSNFARPRTG